MKPNIAGLRRLPHPALVLHPSVAEALASRSSTSKPAKPIVALESAIITHGMPYSVNLYTARRVEETIRSKGAIPATIALLDGKIHVGLDDAQLQRLAECARVKGSAIKTGRRDLASVLASKSIGGTTVSGTSLVARMAGIDIFATGGIGGVHRGAERTFDISSDLTERSPVSIFCSGAKSILDIGLTLEFLETQGVGVHSFGQKGEFPGFYTAKTGYFVDPVTDEEHAARIIWEGSRFRLDGAIFAVPIPAEYEAAGQEIQAAVEQAVQEAAEQGIDKRGKEVTPWLLARVGQLTKGTSLKSNIGLVVNNASKAATTAKILAEMRWQQGKEAKGGKSIVSGWSPSSSDSETSVLVFGCAALDVTASTSLLSPRSTSPGTVRFSSGGVGRNMAEAAHRVLSASASDKGSRPTVGLVAPLQDDAAGHLLKMQLKSSGMTDYFIFPSTEEASSPTAVLQLDATTNDLVSGVVDMSLVEKSLTPTHIRAALGPAVRKDRTLTWPRVVGFDANMTPEAMAELLRWRRSTKEQTDKILLFEPTSVAKCARLIDALKLASSKRSRSLVDYITPNLIELEAMVTRALEIGLIQELSSLGPSPTVEDRLEVMCTALSPWIDHFFVTMGSQGVMSVVKSEGDKLKMEHHPAISLDATSSLVNSTGAGDTFAGVILACLAAQSRSARSIQDWAHTETAMIDLAQRGALMTMQSEEAVSNQVDRLGKLLQSAVQHQSHVL